MKLVIVSDNHGRSDILKELKERYQDEVDVFIHCGDSELSAQDPDIEGYMTVRGNCDTESSFPYDLLEEVEGKRLFITHGHRYNVKMTLQNLVYKAEEYGADFVFFGHTHSLGAEKIGNTIFLNPGSISLPRERTEKTYAIVNVNENQAAICFYDELHQELPELTLTFSH